VGRAWRHRPRATRPPVWAGVALALLPANALAREPLSGRFHLTYQDTRNAGIRQEYFTQRYEATIRDRLFERNNLALTFYFDNADNLTTDLTFRRYRGLLSLENRYYLLSARYTPRQKTSPLEVIPAQETADNQLLLDVRVPQAPRLRLSYGNRDRYFEGQSAGELTELRGDLDYTYRFLTLGLNRYQSKTENASRRENTVTGGDVRVAESFGPEFGFNAGYEYRLNQERRSPGLPTDVTNHNFSGVFTSQYRRYLAATLSLNRRELHIDGAQDSRSTDDNDFLALLFFPGSPLSLELARTFLRTQSDTALTQSDYATVQALAQGEFWKRTRGRAQVSRRMDIDTINGIVPDHIYFVSVQSTLYPGVDLRADASVSERAKDTFLTDRFQSGSLLDLYLRPWNNVSLVPHIQYVRYDDELSFRHNDRAMYGLTANYFPRGGASLGVDMNRTIVTTGRQSTSNAATFNVGLRLRQRSSLNASYAINRTDFVSNRLLWGGPDTQLRTLNLMAQVWLVARGSLSLNFTDIEQNGRDASIAYTVSYRQDF
jgi:hypothetical protein